MDELSSFARRTTRHGPTYRVELQGRCEIDSGPYPANFLLGLKDNDFKPMRHEMRRCSCWSERLAGSSAGREDAPDATPVRPPPMIAMRPFGLVPGAGGVYGCREGVLSIGSHGKQSFERSPPTRRAAPGCVGRRSTREVRRRRRERSKETSKQPPGMPRRRLSIEGGFPSCPPPLTKRRSQRELERAEDPLGTS